MNHANAWDLIPWFVNGRASSRERALVERHLEQCAQCRQEVAAQRVLQQAMRTRPSVEVMPHASLQLLMARVDAQSAAPAPRANAAPRRPRLVSWLAAAIAVQALLLGVLSTVLISGYNRDAGYRTVSTPAAASAAPAVRAVFSPDMRLGELQALLEHAHLRIVNGPSVDGVITLALASTNDDARQALLTLRAHPATRFAEPIGR